MRLLLIYCFLFKGQLTYGQTPLPAFGEFTAEEKNLKECSFDKKAEAVVLFDDAVTEHDDYYHMITRRRVRIKIFNQRELDQASIRIRFYSKDKFEFIRNIRGITYNQEGDQSSISTLDKKSIFTEKEDDYHSSIKFALPNVKPGSIIEYEYESFMENYGGLSHWNFQHELPTIRSSYLLTIIPRAEFQYHVQKRASYPIVIKALEKTGQVYFEMNNIPGLKFEPYMDAVRDYLQKVIFQLSGFTSRGVFTKVKQSWKELAYDLITHKDFGGVIKKDLSKIDEIKTLVARETTDSGKLAAIYNFVRNNIQWNGYYTKFAQEGLKDVLGKRTGAAGEINLLLLNLFEKFNIEAYPLLVAERNFGKIDTAYPFLDKFNKVAAYAIADNKVYILDATQSYSPPGLTPYRLLNTKAFLVDKKDYRFISVSSPTDAYRNLIIVEASVDKQGKLMGTATINSYAYAKQLRTEKAKESTKKLIADVLNVPGSEIVTDNVVLENLDDDTRPLVQKLDFHYEADNSGGFIFVPYNLYMGLVKNPFSSEVRFTNINFGYPYDIRLNAVIRLPEKSKTDKLPPDKIIRSADGGISISRKLKITDNILLVSIEFKQNVTLIDNEDYQDLKSLYKQITDLLNEQVIIKIEN